MIFCDLLFVIFVQCVMQGMAQVDRPALNIRPVRVRKAECTSLLDPAPDPNSCACNIIRGIPAGAIFIYPPTKGVTVNWDRVKASVHYWKCFPKGVTLPPTDYSDATEPNYSDEKESENRADDHAAG